MPQLTLLCWTGVAISNQKGSSLKRAFHIQSAIDRMITASLGLDVFFLQDIVRKIISWVIAEKMINLSPPCPERERDGFSYGSVIPDTIAFSKVWLRLEIWIDIRSIEGTLWLTLMRSLHFGGLRENWKHIRQNHFSWPRLEGSRWAFVRQIQIWMYFFWYTELGFNLSGIQPCTVTLLTHFCLCDCGLNPV